MADHPINSVKHIEAYVNSSSSRAQQDASVDAIASLLKNDALTLESLVREMDMYLTTTDSIIRARGILLLAELLTRQALKPLDSTTLSTLIGFFTERLADWKALRGALVGCLALMKRKGGIGTITGSEANAVALSFMQNIQVQSLGQHDRKLCFDLLGCLVDRYPDAVVALGDDFVYTICEATDGERDPQCLLLTFHIVEVLARVFPDSSGPLSNFAGDLFDILGSYFPIHFTHPKGEDDVKREELSGALMMAFASTPFYEPFAIPLLLEKLSSSLSSAKVESLKYLSYCTVMYGADNMIKHLEAMWGSIKDAIFTSEPSVFSMESESPSGMGHQDDEIVTEALILLEKVIQQNGGLCLSLIAKDEDLNTTINSMSSFNVYDDIPTLSKQRLHAVGRILYVSAKVSVASCNAVFECFFPRLLKYLGIVDENGVSHSEKDFALCGRPKFGPLYLCVKLIAACRSLVVGSEGPTSISVSGHETWCTMLNSFCSFLVASFSSAITSMDERSIRDPYIFSGVHGLKIMATFPGSFLPVSKSIFENILGQLMAIIVMEFNKMFLWRLALKALVDIGLFIEKSHDSEKAPSFDDIVVERMISLISSNEVTLPLSLKVEALSDIGMTSLNFMQKIVRGLSTAIFTNLSEFSIHGDSKSAEFALHLLECYSNKVLPWFQNIGGADEVPFHFAINIWDEVKGSMSFSSNLQQNRLLEAVMTAMKHAVGYCSVVRQSAVLDKAFSILLSSTTFDLKKSSSASMLVNQEGLPESIDCFSCKDEWIISLFTSVVIALHPGTLVKNMEVILEVLVRTLLKGHVSSAQALGSLLNKLPLRGNTMDVPGDYNLEEALDVVLRSNLWMSYGAGQLTRFFSIDDGNGIDVSSLRLSNASGSLVHVQAIVGLAWIGKGLLMRGHEKVKDVIMAFLSCLMSSDNISALSRKLESHEDGKECEVLHLMRSVADSFHIMLSDSEDCLNRRFHATIKPLYKQRFFSIVMPILRSSVMKSDSTLTRSMLYRSLAHVISDTPLSAILGEANKLIFLLVDGLSVLREDILNRDIIYNLLLVLSGILTDKNGQEAVVENAHIIIRCLIELISYPHMTLIRETAIQCLIAMSELPQTRIYPQRPQVLLAISKSLDDPKRIVRQEAVRCRQAWASLSSRSLRF